jgi:hypothetical protein
MVCRDWASPRSCRRTAPAEGDRACPDSVPRLPLLFLGYAAAHAEATRGPTSTGPGGYNSALAAHWFDVVANLGYMLIDVEHQVACPAWAVVHRRNPQRIADVR